MAEPKPLLVPLKPRTSAPRIWTPRGFQPEAWQAIADDAQAAPGSSVIVSLARWRREHTALLAIHDRVGVVLSPPEAIDAAADRLGELALISLAFPKFSDGRAYSTARRLREIIGFRGVLRATGDVLLDQLPLMLRCGFDSFEIVDSATLAALERDHLPAITRTYQRSAGGDGRWRLRPAAASALPPIG